MVDLALVIVLAACAPVPPARTVPRTPTAITVDGDWHEKAWNDLALTGRFVGQDGQMARPVSEVRLLVDDTRLLVGLYAADEDIRSTDVFDLTVGSTHLRFDPLGDVTPALPGAVALVDSDGTVDQPSDSDEEWVVEAGIPLAALGLSAGAHGIPLTASRCDVPRDGIRRCGSWRSTLALGTGPVSPPPRAR